MVVSDLDEDKNELNNALDDYQSAQDDLPTVPSDLDDLLDADQLDGGVQVLTSVLDWEAIGLSSFIPIICVGLGLCILFFVIFGKSG